MKDKLTKREKFALEAMKALIKNEGIEDDWDSKSVSKKAVKIADRMIKKLKL